MDRQLDPSYAGRSKDWADPRAKLRVSGFRHIVKAMGEKAPEAKEVAILVDFDNVCHQVEPTAASLTNLLNQWVRAGVNAAPLATTVAARLYGGWHQDDVLTRAASQLSAALPKDFFPFKATHEGISRVVGGTIVLATELLAVPSIQWGHTFQEKRGLPRLRLAETPRPDGCANHENCPIGIMRHITRDRKKVCKIDSCSVQNRTAFLLKEQKMVDTLMACDAIELARQNVPMVILSNDLDLLPSLAVAATYSNQPILHVRGPDSGPGDYYSGRLSSVGVISHSLEAA